MATFSRSRRFMPIHAAATFCRTIQRVPLGAHLMSDIPLPLGFQTSGVACGVRGNVGRLDLALFVSDRPATAVGVFTQNLVCGAPVKVSRERVPCASGRAVVINAGNANA